MTPVGNAYIFYTQTFPQKKFFVTKNIFFSLISLHFHLIDHIRKQTWGKKFLHSFIQLTLNVFLIFDIRHVVREVGRKLVMEHVF